MNTYEKLSKDFPDATPEQLAIMSQIEGTWTKETDGYLIFNVLERYGDGARKSYLFVGSKLSYYGCLPNFEWLSSIRGIGKIYYPKINKLILQHLKLKNFL